MTTIKINHHQPKRSTVPLRDLKVGDFFYRPEWGLEMLCQKVSTGSTTADVQVIQTDAGAAGWYPTDILVWPVRTIEITTQLE